MLPLLASPVLQVMELPLATPESDSVPMDRSAATSSGESARVWSASVVLVPLLAVKVTA